MEVTLLTTIILQYLDYIEFVSVVCFTITNSTSHVLFSWPMFWNVLIQYFVCELTYILVSGLNSQNISGSRDFNRIVKSSGQ